MHIERNVCHSLLEYLLGECDTVVVRRDLEEVGTMEQLWLRRTEDLDTYIMPHAPYVLKEEERAVFLHLFSTIRTPIGHSATVSRHVSQGKLSGLKSHDYHILMQ
jgi:hypothetical protein